MNPVVPRLVALLKDPTEEWEFGDYTADNTRRGLRVWTANFPVFDTELHPVPAGLGLLDKWRVWRALKVARTNYWIRKLTKP